MAARDISEAPPHVQTAVRAYAALNQRDVDAAVPELDETKTCTTREEAQAKLAALLGAFSDAQVSNLRAFDLGDGRVAVRFRFTGTNDGPLGPDAPATGRHVDAVVLDVIRFDAEGRVIDARNLSEQEPIRRQLGLVQ